MKTPRLLFRFITVGAMVLLLLLPLSMIRDTIHERQAFRNEAVQRVAQGMAGPQRLVGPLRLVPWTGSRDIDTVDAQGRARTERRTDQGYVLQAPRTLDIQGRLVPGTRRIGLHEVRVYEWRASLRAGFAEQPLPVVAGRAYGTPSLVFGIADVRGLVGTPVLVVDGRPLRLLPGARELAPRLAGVHATLPAATGALPAQRVALDFVLAGTESLAIAPVADGNRIAIDSTWPHPLFGGQFLPRTRRVSARGFAARWDISSLASAAQSQLRDTATAADALDSLQLSLVDPVNVYSQAERASKYGILFVVLTFVGFALFELLKRLPIHPLQYLLVGLALAIFFLLLLSLSEHIPFWQAYVASAVACISLQGMYLAHVLHSRARGWGFAAMLAVLYAVLYGLLSSEDNALLMGSLLLFGILAAIMWITRKLDWYELGAGLH